MRSSPRSPATPVAQPGVRELYRDPYIVVSLDPHNALVRVTRSATIHPDIAALNRSYASVIAALDRVGRQGRAMLVDTRAPAGRNDPEFEQAMAALRPRLDRGFARIGVLVRSVAGALQMRRWMSQDGTRNVIGSDEAEVLAALREG